jgi:hypothetical protein
MIGDLPMRHFYLIFALLCILVLAACGSEEELTPPAFINITASGTLVSPTILTAPSQDPGVTISGNIDDLAATIVADSTVSGKVPVIVESDGRWSFTFAPQEGANLVSLTATDARGNINQMILTVTHDTTPPVITTVTQSVDPSPQLLVTFNETLLESSLATTIFAVDATQLPVGTLDTLLTKKTVTLALDGALAPGTYRLTCPGVTDIATPNGNSVTADYFFDFTIQ